MSIHWTKLQIFFKFNWAYSYHSLWINVIAPQLLGTYVRVYTVSLTGALMCLLLCSVMDYAAAIHIIDCFLIDGSKV